MIVRAGDLHPEGVKVDQRPEVGPLGYVGGLTIGIADTKLEARVVPSKGGLRCSGRVEATASVPCSRCLEPYPFPVRWDFDVTYLPAALDPGHGRRDEELQISKDDLDVAYLDSEGLLDLDSLVREQIYLALPMKPLCSPDCRGLCPSCGSNLNIEVCHCVPIA